MLKFTMHQHRVTVDPASLTLEPLRQIWMADKSKTKDEATLYLTYIHIVSQIDTDAPFAKSDPTEVVPLAKKEIFGDYNFEFFGTFDEKFMEEAVISYQLAYESPEEATVRAFNKKIYQIQRMLDETDIEIKSSTVRGAVTYVSNFPILNKMMQDMSKISKARDELEASIVRGSSRGEMKGQKKLNFIEKKRRDMNKSKEGIAPADEEEENF